MLAIIATSVAAMLGYYWAQTPPKRSGWEILLPTSWVEERKRGIIPSSFGIMDLLWIAPLFLLLYWTAESIAVHCGHDHVLRDINRTLRKLTRDVQTEATDTEDRKSKNSTNPGSQADGPYKKAKTLRQSGQSETQHSRQQPGKSTESNGAKEAASATGHSIQKNESKPSTVLKRQSEAEALALAQAQAQPQAQPQAQEQARTQEQVQAQEQSRAQEQARAQGQARAQEQARAHEQVELEVEAEVYSHTLDRPRYNRHRRAQSHPHDYGQRHNVHGDFAFHAHHQQRYNHNQAYFPTSFIAVIPEWSSQGHAHCSPQRCPLWFPRCHL
ncbi:hypothetical protein BJX62DRAFT_239973 [Aspergillus germanicus]